MINTKLKPIAIYGIQLMIGQLQIIILKTERLLMRINQDMTNSPEGLCSYLAICKSINIDTPRQDIVKTSFTLIHKMIERLELILSYQYFQNQCPF